jgi:nicotinamide riboside kinase
VKIARGQLQQEQNQLNAKPPLLFADTEMLVCEIWLQFVFGLKNEFIEEALQKQNYDLYLLCDIDLEWEPDPLREHPDQRETLFDLYESRLKSLRFPYRIVNGKGNQRLTKAVNFVDEILKN